MCYQLQLQSDVNQTHLTFNFTTAASSYDLRDVSTPTGLAACVLQPSPPPPSPPLPPAPPAPVTPTCASDAGIFVRYVRMTWRGGAGCANNSYLSVAELRVFYNGVNVAADAPATASDTWASDPAYAPGKLVDGSTTTFYHSSTAGSSTYVQVDLQVGGIQYGAVNNVHGWSGFW